MSDFFTTRYLSNISQCLIMVFILQSLMYICLITEGTGMGTFIYAPFTNWLIVSI